MSKSSNESVERPRVDSDKHVVVRSKSAVGTIRRPSRKSTRPKRHFSFNQPSNSLKSDLDRAHSSSDPDIPKASGSEETLSTICEREETRTQSPYAHPYRELRHLTSDSTLSSIDELDGLGSIPGASAIAMATGLYRGFTYNDAANHAEAVLAAAANAQKESLFTDVIVNVSPKQYECHRLILSACSPYFRSLILGHNVGKGARLKRTSLIGDGKKVIELTGIKSDIFEVVLSYVYTGEVMTGSPELMQDVFKAANRFNMPKLKTAAAEYLFNCLDVANCFTVLQLASDHNSDALYEKAEKFVLENFEASCQEPGYLELGVDTLKKLLGSPSLNVQEEEIAFEAAMRWVKHRPTERANCLPGVMSLIKFSQMQPQTLLGLMNDKNLDNSKECRTYLKRALDYLHSGKQHGQMCSEWIIPRASTGIQESIICLPGVGNTAEVNLNVIAYNDSLSVPSSLINSTETLDESPKWEYLTPLPVNPGYHYAACVYENNVYVSGGESTPTTVWKFDTTFRQWLPCAPLKQGRVCHAMVVGGANIFALGGRAMNGEGDGTNGTVLASIEKYAVQVNRWITVGKLQTSVHSMAFASYKEKIYLFGGRDENDFPTDVVQRFRCNGNYLKTISPLPHKAAFIRAAVLNSVIYVLLNDMLLCFCVETETFTELTRLDMPLVSPGLTHFQGHLVICGGLTELSPGTRIAVDEVKAYDPKKRSWIVRDDATLALPTQMPTALSYLSAVTVHRPINQQGQKTLARQSESIRKRASEC